MSLTALNRVIYDLQFPDLRVHFRSDPERFFASYDLSDEEKAAVGGPDLRTLWRVGVNPYLLRFFQHWNQITDEEFRTALSGLSFHGSLVQDERDG